MSIDLTCCADLYHLPLVRGLLGDTLHPGGLALTRNLGKELGLGPGLRLLDVACGHGAGAIMLAQVYKCQVVGIDTDQRAIDEAIATAKRYRLEGLATFKTADVGSLPFPASAFDAVICECATSLFADRNVALGEMARLLKAGSRLALSDVTFRPTSLPKVLDFSLAQAMCIPMGTGPDEFVNLIERVGLRVDNKSDCSDTIADLITKVESFLGTAGSMQILGDAETGDAGPWEAALRSVRQLIESGDLGYWAFVASKPEVDEGKLDTS